MHPSCVKAPPRRVGIDDAITAYVSKTAVKKTPDLAGINTSYERALGPESESMVKELWKQSQARDWSISSAVKRLGKIPPG